MPPKRHLDSCHASSCSLMTEPARRISDAVEGNACTTLDLHFISRFVCSWTLVMRKRFLCDSGKSWYARASGSASSRIATALGQHPFSMSHARTVHGGHGGGVAPAEHL
nr:hypothetical protein [Collinsella sp. AM24-1]